MIVQYNLSSVCFGCLFDNHRTVVIVCCENVYVYT